MFVTNININQHSGFYKYKIWLLNTSDERHYMIIFIISKFTLNVHYTFQNRVKKVKLATIVEGDPKAPFLIAYYTKV